MFFLCPRHRHHVAGLPLKDQQDLWFRWLGHGGLFYDLGVWHDAIPYLGCAYDLAEERVFQSTGGQEPPLLQLTLSAVYLVNACLHQGDPYRARCAERRALTSLHLAEGGTWENQSLREYYAAIIRDVDRHEAFFRDYLNLPFEALNRSVVISRTR